MRTFTAELESISDYGQSRYHGTPMKEKEIPKDYEVRTWREKMHVNKDGFVYIPPTAFKNSLSQAAKYIGMSIPGKGKERYTKNFEAGVSVIEPLVLSIKKDDVEGIWLFVPSNGIRGGNKRVHKCFPCIRGWSGSVVYHVWDDIVTDKVFKYHLEQCGKFIGIGFFRPRNNGFWGRFKVNKIVETKVG